MSEDIKFLDITDTKTFSALLLLKRSKLAQFSPNLVSKLDLYQYQLFWQMQIYGVRELYKFISILTKEEQIEWNNYMDLIGKDESLNKTS